MQRHRNHVEVGRTARHVAALAHAPQGGDLITHPGGTLEFQRFGGGVHLLCQLGGKLIGLPAQQTLGVIDVTGIFITLDQRHARCRTPLDLMLQTGPVAMREKAVTTGPKLKKLLQRDQGFHGPRRR